MKQLVFPFEDYFSRIENAIEHKFFELGFNPTNAYICEEIQELSQTYKKYTGCYYRRRLKWI